MTYNENMDALKDERIDSSESTNDQSSGWDEVAAMAKEKPYIDSHEAKKLEHDMADARDYIDYDHRKRFQKQRTQEIIELGLNNKLLKIDQLEIEVFAGNPGVSKDSISFDGTDITVYDLHGIPFSLLSTTIDYRKDSHHQGSKTYLEVMKHPEIWTERRDQVETLSSFGTVNQNARGDTISASYYNSESNLDNHVHGELLYGFDHVDADSILYVANSDGSTGNNWGSDDTKLDERSFDAIEKLEGPGGDGVYNEVCLRRYSVNGFPKRPDYIITEDGKISEATKRHAKFFDIPIININNKAYQEKMLARGEAIISSISESDNYADIDRKYSELYSMSAYKGRENRPTLELVDIGGGYPVPQYESRIGMAHKDIVKLELSKRLEFIEQSLQKAKSNYEEAIQSHQGRYGVDEFPDFDYFMISLRDAQHENGQYEGNGYYYPAFRKLSPGDCSQIEVEFRLKGSSRRVKTIIYDGERRVDSDEALARGYIRPEIISNSNSSFYDALEPIVRQYFDAKAQYRNM